MKKAELSMRELIEIVIAALAILFVFLPLSMAIYSAYFVSNNPILDNRIENTKNVLEDINQYINSPLNMKIYFPGNSEAEDGNVPDFIKSLFENDPYYEVIFRSSDRRTEICYKIGGRGSCESLDRGITFFYQNERCGDDNRCSFQFRNIQKMYFLDVSYNGDTFTLEGVK